MLKNMKEVSKEIGKASRNCSSIRNKIKGILSQAGISLYFSIEDKGEKIFYDFPYDGIPIRYEANKLEECIPIEQYIEALDTYLLDTLRIRVEQEGNYIELLKEVTRNGSKKETR